MDGILPLNGNNPVDRRQVYLREAGKFRLILAAGHRRWGGAPLDARYTVIVRNLAAVLLLQWLLLLSRWLVPLSPRRLDLPCSARKLRSRKQRPCHPIVIDISLS